MANVILINVFEVPAGRDGEFLQHWETARDFMQRQKGYVATRLHRSLNDSARFRFINVAEWQTAADFQAAFSHLDFAKLRETMPFAHDPSLYEVIRT
jgi:heme oxygenase (mycobilin-producing)